MIRNIDINEISDGNRYSNSDIVKIGCNDCKGCSKCCEHMSGLITLDPYDIFRMCLLIEGSSFQSLLEKNIGFTVDRSVILPVLKMDEESDKCTFLNSEGRCSIHAARPGVCRLFPLGRIYENDSFSYFLQKDECDYKAKSKVKIKNWLETKDIKRYEEYISNWHYFIRDIQEYMKSASEDEISQINSYLIKIFFTTPYDEEFYTDFYERLAKVKELL